MRLSEKTFELNFCSQFAQLWGHYNIKWFGLTQRQEAKAGFDVVDLRRKYGHKIAFCGNMNVIDWANSPIEELNKIVLTKLNAAKGGGWIFQSDNAVPDTVTPERYEHVINLARKYGKSPITLGEYDIPDMS